MNYQILFYLYFQILIKINANLYFSKKLKFDYLTKRKRKITFKVIVLAFEIESTLSKIHPEHLLFDYEFFFDLLRPFQSTYRNPRNYTAYNL